MADILTSLIGGFFGGGNDEQTQTSTNAPWAAAQPFMLRNLQDTEKLGNYYKQNPFNKQQTESYSNLFSDNNNFRNNIAPGLMNFANQGMTGGYQRATGGRPGDGAGYGGARQPGGRSGGLLSASAGPFSVGQSGAQSGGLLDLNVAQNPFANGGVTQNPQTVTEEMISELKAGLESPGGDQDRGGDDGGYQSGGGFNTNAPEAPAWMGALSPMALAAYNGLMRNGFDPTKGALTDPSLQFGTDGWAKAVNDYAAARAAREGGGGYGGGYDVGGVDYGNDAMDYGG